jgi:hypothetical protein
LGKAKQCSFCAFSSDDPAAFGVHMRDVHQWDRLASARHSPRSQRARRLGYAGGVLAAAALAVVTWNGERQCRIAENGVGWCAEIWLVFVVLVPFVAAIGFALGFVLGPRLTRPKAD